jgi:DNA processing protein
MQTKEILLSRTPNEISPKDPRWPKGLCDLSDPPLRLRIAGELPVFEKSVAIVGTRSADEEAVDFTRELAAQLCQAGFGVISGGAYGIDAAAHQGALDVSGRTIAILATGLKEAYPPHHGPLFGQIAQQGALVTEAEDGISPKPGLFLKRNRLIAAMARAVVVVQAPYRSGALSTARWAKCLNRPLLATPAAPWEPRGAGCLQLIRNGATICTSARDVISVCIPDSSPDATNSRVLQKKACDFNAFDDDEEKVLRTLNRIPRHPDELSRKTGLPVFLVQRVLLTLLLHGIVEERNGGRYVRRDPEIRDGNGKENDSSKKDEKQGCGNENPTKLNESQKREEVRQDKRTQESVDKGGQEPLG